MCKTMWIDRLQMAIPTDVFALAIRKEKMKSLLHLVFPGGHPSWY